MTAVRMPPHSLEAEQAVLGGLLIDPGAWVTIEGTLTAGDFYRHDHRLIFAAIGELAERGEPLDMVTVSAHMEATATSVEAGGLPYLAQLATGTPSAANIQAHARIVADRARRRDLVALATEVQDSAFDPGSRATTELYAHAETRLAALGGAIGNRDVVSMRDTLGEAVEALEARYESKSPITGIPTGYQDLDELTAGLQPSDLIVLAGRPSMGKTALASCIAEYAAIKRRKPVLFCTMEMSTQQMALRFLASMGRINMQTLRTGRMDEADWPRLTSAVSMLADTPIYFDSRSRSVADVRATARRIPDLQLIIIDYLGLMSGEGETQTLRIGAMVAGVKHIALDLDIPIVLLAQLNRGVENRPNKRPMLSDLRDSGEVEQHADVVMFVYRDEVYNPDSPDKGIAELIVAKQRNGPVDTVRLTFRGQFARFENYHPDVYGAGF